MANSFGGWLTSAIAWRGTFCDLQAIIPKSLAAKKFPAKALGGEVSLAGNFSSPALVDYKCVAKPRRAGDENAKDDRPVRAGKRALCT